MFGIRRKSPLWMICISIFILMEALGVQVIFHGSGQSISEGQSIWLMGGCQNERFTEIANTTVKDGRWTVKTELKSCDLHWKWRLGNGSWEIIDGGNRKISIPDVKRQVVIYSNFSRNEAKLYQDQEVQFILENPPQLDIKYQVCGMCSRSSVRPGFDQWTCSEGALPREKKVLITRKLTTWCNFEWKWRSEKSFENFLGNRGYYFNEQGECQELGLAVFNGRWSENSEIKKSCENLTPTTTVSTTKITRASKSASQDAVTVRAEIAVSTTVDTSTAETRTSEATTKTAETTPQETSTLGTTTTGITTPNTSTLKTTTAGTTTQETTTPEITSTKALTEETTTSNPTTTESITPDTTTTGTTTQDTTATETITTGTESLATTAQETTATKTITVDITISNTAPTESTTTETKITETLTPGITNLETKTAGTTTTKLTTPKTLTINTTHTETSTEKSSVETSEENPTTVRSFQITNTMPSEGVELTDTYSKTSTLMLILSGNSLSSTQSTTMIPSMGVDETIRIMHSGTSKHIYTTSSEIRGSHSSTSPQVYIIASSAGSGLLVVVVVSATILLIKRRRPRCLKHLKDSTAPLTIGSSEPFDEFEAPPPIQPNYQTYSNKVYEGQDTVPEKY